MLSAVVETALPLGQSKFSTKHISTETVHEIRDGSSSDEIATKNITQTPATIARPLTNALSKSTSGLFITGLGHQYPPYLIYPNQVQPFLSKFYNVEARAIKKLLQINQTTMIKSRSCIKAYEDPFWNRSEPPNISELDSIFRKFGVNLAVQACKKALRDATLSASDITHTVAVTCTSAGNPGFDLLVSDKLGLGPTVEHTLLHGVGCAGGLSAVRAAASLAQSASMRGRPARILVFACEVCSTNIRCDLQEMIENPEEVKISPVLFSDAAAALVLCNELGTTAAAGDSDGLVSAAYELIDWEVMTLPNTSRDLEFMARTTGFQATLTKNVPEYAMGSIEGMFERLLPHLPAESELAKTKVSKGEAVRPNDFDWALHPGGIAILNGAQQKLELEEEQLRASFDVYRNHGNSSSPTVLVVLDQLRKMGEGRENVMACSFGPGMTVEMALMRRCRGEEGEDDDE